MRIVAGKYRGKVLKEFKGTEVRPTSDRAKEALFNILQFSIVGASFYDAFCGSGSVGIEAISRGAKSVVFSDISGDSVQLTKGNLKLINENCDVLLIDAVKFLETTDKEFDYIFLDPPYASQSGIEALKVIAKRKLLSNDGFVIYEHKAGNACEIDGLTLIKTRKYGIAEFSFYKVQ